MQCPKCKIWVSDALVACPICGENLRLLQALATAKRELEERRIGQTTWLFDGQPEQVNLHPTEALGRSEATATPAASSPTNPHRTPPTPPFCPKADAAKPSIPRAPGSLLEALRSGTRARARIAAPRAVACRPP